MLRRPVFAMRAGTVVRGPRVMRAGIAPGDLPLVVAGFGGLSALAWFDLWRRAGATTPGGGMATGMAMPQPMPWSLPDLFAASAMWSVMTIAMMLPSATPMLISLPATQPAQGAAAAAGAPGTALFAVGFLLVWVAWSWLAAGLQWVLQAFVALSPQLTVVPSPLAAAILIVAGLHQLTPLKEACLARCQGFLLTRWRGGPWGALQMGGRYAAYSVGSCWALMGLLLVVGVMNLLWIVVLSIYVLIEKTLLRGPWLGRVTGCALIAWALYLLRMPAT